MNTEELLDSLFSLLEQRCGAIAVKDFTGFIQRLVGSPSGIIPQSGVLATGKECFCVILLKRAQ